MSEIQISIDDLIEIVSNGGTVRTGVDVYNSRGVLLLEKSVSIDDIKVLNIIRENGILEIPISDEGGIWDNSGKSLSASSEPDSEMVVARLAPRISGLEQKLNEIIELKNESSKKFEEAKKNIRTTFGQIKESEGEFDYEVAKSSVKELLDFFSKYDEAFSYLSKEIFSYDDYLYNHCVNTCIIGITVLNRFNNRFSASINNFLTNSPFDISEDSNYSNGDISFQYLLPEEIMDISIGYFLHDMGKVLIPEHILNKQGKLTPKEFEIVKTHADIKGSEILMINRINNPYIANSVCFHHSALYKGEKGCYPLYKTQANIPIYVKICKLADMYDAMTSKRSYKDAYNPIRVVTEIFHKYAKKDQMLQLILHSFVKTIGIHPPGSIVTLRNGCLAFIIDNIGPLLLPFTDPDGNTLKQAADPVNLSELPENSQEMQIDNRKPLMLPIEAYDKLPSYLRGSIGIGR